MLTKAPPFYFTCFNLTQKIKKHSRNTHECQSGLVYVSIIELLTGNRGEHYKPTLIITHEIKKATVHLKRRKKLFK